MVMTETGKTGSLSLPVADGALCGDLNVRKSSVCQLKVAE